MGPKQHGHTCQPPTIRLWLLEDGDSASGAPGQPRAAGLTAGLAQHRDPHQGTDERLRWKGAVSPSPLRSSTPAGEGDSLREHREGGSGLVTALTASCPPSYYPQPPCGEDPHQSVTETEACRGPLAACRQPAWTGPHWGVHTVSSPRAHHAPVPVRCSLRETRKPTCPGRHSHSLVAVGAGGRRRGAELLSGGTKLRLDKSQTGMRRQRVGEAGPGRPCTPACVTQSVYVPRARPRERGGVKAVGQRTRDRAGGTECRPLGDSSCLLTAQKEKGCLGEQTCLQGKRGFQTAASSLRD